jgi:hypothetical protein
MLVNFKEDLLDVHKNIDSTINNQNVVIDYDKYTIEIVDRYNTDVVRYVPTTTALKFHSLDDRVRVVRGHVGSGKTTMMCAEIIFRACAMPPCRDGIRRSRWAVIRNTYGDLVKTTIHTWNQWWRYLGKQVVKQTPSYSIVHTFNDGKGIIEMELLPIALDNAVDVTKHLKSLEVTGVFLNELSELHPLVLTFFSGGRLPRFPRKLDFPQEVQDQTKIYWSGIFSDTNPPDQDSWIYDLFEVERPPEYTMMTQPPAVIKTHDGYIINPDAENICHIQNGAEEFVKMTYGKTENFIRVYLMGEYGTISEEKKVYQNYNDNIHSSDYIKIIPNEPIIISFDLGTVAPTGLIAQFVDGILYGIKEFCGQFMTITELVENSVIPWLNTNCEKNGIQVCLHDPADTYDGAEQLREFFGAVVEPGITNKIDLRINGVSRFLNKLVGGKPAIVISRDGCMQLRKGFNGKYFYRRLKVIGEERYTDEPYKNHPFSDVHDALAYICGWLNKELSFDIDEQAEYDAMYRFRQKRVYGSNKITGY